ncbi:MAG: hypothetical protein R3267_04230 [Paenisporosarcina sp.]|nr:hypothetical protein [Paenisporosarcina sp.]
MTFLELKHEIKEEQKALAQEIKEFKALRKDSPDGYVEGLWHRSDDYRHTHIAYCQFFNNTPYEKIERNCHENPRKVKIESHMTIWASRIDEALRDCA